MYFDGTSKICFNQGSKRKYLNKASKSCLDERSKKCLTQKVP